MRSGFRQRVAERSELLVLGFTLLVVGSLVGWWTILLRGELRTNQLLELKLSRTSAATSRRRNANPRLSQPDARRSTQPDAGGRVDHVGTAVVGQPVVVPAGAASSPAAPTWRNCCSSPATSSKTSVAGVKGLLQSLSLGAFPAQRAELIQLGQLECDRLEHLAETILADQRAMSRQPRGYRRPSTPRASSPNYWRTAHAPRAAARRAWRRWSRRGAGTRRSRCAARDPREPAGQRPQVRLVQSANSPPVLPMAAGVSTSATVDAASRPSPPKNSLISTIAAAVGRHAWRRPGSRHPRASWRGAWAVTSAPSVRVRGRARCSR